MADLRAASQSIHLVYYEWASDRFTKEVADILAAKVASGVDVRILYDPVGSLRMLSWRYVRSMRNAGIEMFPYSPLYALHTISYRNHRKIAVIDGRVGYSGGLEHDGDASVRTIGVQRLARHARPCGGRGCSPAPSPVSDHVVQHDRREPLS